MAKLYTEIKSAKVFLKGAEVTRKGKCELAQGKQTLFVYGLSSGTVYSTVRLFGEQGLIMGNLRYEVKENDEFEDNELNRLQKQIDELNRSIEIKQLQISLWQTNGDFTNRTSQNGNEIKEYIEKLPERLNGLNEDILEAQKKLRDLSKKLELEQSKGSLWRSKLRKQESIPLNCATTKITQAGKRPMRSIRMQRKIWRSA